MQTATSTLSTFHLAKVQDKVAKFNKAAEKVGAPAISLSVANERDVTEVNEYGDLDVVDRVADFTITWEGEVRLPGGWRFLAAIDHLGEQTNIVRPFVREDEEVAEDAFAAYFEVEPNCDHCGLNRDRKMTVLIEDEAGERKQVGTSCLRDFLGHDPKNVLWIVEQDINGFFEEGGFGGPEYDPTRRVLNQAAACVRVLGWTPKSAPDWKTPTVSSVNFNLYPPKGMSTHDFETHGERAHVTFQDRETVQRAFEWLADDERSGNSDYIRNLRSVCMSDFALPKYLGLLVSLIGAYERAIGKEAERRAREQAERARRATAAPVPVTSERIRIEGIVVKVDVKEGWGYNSPKRTVITVLDDRGFKVWGTAPSSIKGKVEVETRVAFDAAVEPSDRDETFGFFSRPTKAKVI